LAFTSNTGQTRSSLAEINVTPLVDVVLVLLIIFMISAPVLQSGIEVSVPKTRTVKDLRADENVPFGAFASVMDAVKQAGVTNISIVTQPLEAKASTEGGN